MKAVLKTTGERVFVLNKVSEMGSSHLSVLFPFAAPSRKGHMGDVRSVRRDKVALVSATSGLNEA